MKIALGVEYNGHGLYGWQYQTNLPTVQGHLENALSVIADHPIKLTCAGRTDANVHATNQVVHFETEAKRIPRAWIQGTNTHLPENIAVRWMKEVSQDFHARYSATSRRYRYLIYNELSRPALLAHRVTWQYDDLNIATMQTAANFLLGEQDFSSFRSAECESRTPMRNVMHISIYRQDSMIMIEIEANAFLHHMVRNIVGVLIRIGRGFEEPEWMLEVLNARDRRKAADTAPASGLYLIKVGYPEAFEIPTPPTVMPACF
ncbi:MAG TPA: tRNA pseudouridine(38-40) synthase TruA [Gammaproteobacteria bacterium]|jgi:tRNA pseudouridine38-40 synthase|nr:tRNA pseudouridine(38-40) synthase TruA [Gammaproteobacteria bacterium]